MRGGTVHLFKNGYEPATRFNAGAPAGVDHWIHWAHRKIVWASCCETKRWAGHCRVQVYYDLLRFSCSPGKGCNRKEVTDGPG